MTVTCTESALNNDFEFSRVRQAWHVFEYLQEMVEFTPVQVWGRHPGVVTEGLWGVMEDLAIQGHTLDHNLIPQIMALSMGMGKGVVGRKKATEGSIPS